MGYLQRMLSILIFRKKWRKANKHNQTSVATKFNLDKVSVGYGTYGRLNISTFDNSSEEVLSIGNYCSIAGNVHFICGGEHYTNRLLTYPITKKIWGTDEALSKGKIIIEDDVWLGTNALILSGVHIGRGAIIAAGSVVARDIPPYSIAAGTPAKVIKYRFNQDIIDKLMLLDYKKINTNFIESHKGLFLRKLNLETVETLLKELGE